MASRSLLGLDTAWILLLALGYLVARREIAIQDSRTRRYGGSVPDGLEIGVAMPRTSGVPNAGLFIFLFADCGPCHELLDKLNGSKGRVPLAIVVSDGHTPGAANALLEKIPSEMTQYGGAAGQHLADVFKVHSGPLGIAVRNGVVVAKGYLRHEEDVRRLASGVE